MVCVPETVNPMQKVEENQQAILTKLQKMHAAINNINEHHAKPRYNPGKIIWVTGHIIVLTIQNTETKKTNLF